MADLTSTRWILPALAVICLTMALSSRAAIAAGQTGQQSPTTSPVRVAEMQHHFLEVTRIHEAVIRGQLGAVFAPAASLAQMQTPANMPAAGAPFLAAIRQSARAASTAPSIEAAATETVSMLQQCAACHRAVGIYPAPASPRRAEVGGVVGHMLEHQRGVDDMLQGLVIPSNSRWQEGAGRLQAAPVHDDAWPNNPTLTQEVRRLDQRVHTLAERAAAATDNTARASVYVDILTTCANCHGLFRQSVGPRSVPGR